MNATSNDLHAENTSENQAASNLGNISTSRDKDFDITSAQELKIINIILESIKV